MQKLLVSVRGPIEAMEAAKGGAHIADVEYPASALGTPYPFNIFSVRERLIQNHFEHVHVSTNIGEIQFNRSTACQSVIGVGIAGADIIKFGLGEETLESAAYLGGNIVRSVRDFIKEPKKLIPAVFVDNEMQRYFKPLVDGVTLAVDIKADGILIDTFNKSIGKGLLDYYKVADIIKFVDDCHQNKIEAWIAGSITKEELIELWKTDVDVICVRGAACEQTGKGRFGEVKEKIVRELVETIPN